MTTLLPAAVTAAHPGWSSERIWENEAGGFTIRLTSPAGAVRYAKAQATAVWPPLSAEVARLRWAGAHLPVPALVDSGEANGVAWMVTEAADGEPAIAPALLAEPEVLVSTLAEGLRRFHAAPARRCPFRFEAEAALAHVEDRVAAGLIEPRHLHDEHAHLSAEQALAQLQRERPERESLVVCHGDYCLPNALIRDGRVATFLDLGELGVADRWWDLAAATWSVTWNLGPGFEDAFLEAYGAPRDDRKLRWYRLLYDLAS